MSGKPLLHVFFIFLLIVCIFTIASTAQQRPVISGPVDDSVRVTIAGSRHPLAQPQFDVGSVDPGTKLDRMLLVLAPTAQQEADLQKFLDSQQDKASPNYHHWLTPDEFAQKFGPAPQDIQTVTAWLQSRGFSVTAVARSGRWLEFSGTAGQTERAFGTLLRQYDVAGSRHIANASDISLPAAIAPVVRGVVSLHNFFKKPMLSHYVKARSNGDGTYTPIAPDATLNTPSGPIHALTPGDYAKIYQLNPLYTSNPPLNGTGVTIAIVARSDVNVGDWLDFRAITGIPPGGGINNTLTLPPDPGFDPNNGDAVEASLDAQWAGGVAPGAFIDVVVSASTATTDGVDLSSAYIVDQNLAPVMSVSFGDCESDLGAAENAFYNALWQQAAAQGISVMVSSGDSGAAGCDFDVQPTAATGGLAVSGLASTPFNTAVGGTEFQESGSTVFWNATNTTSGVSVNGYIPEVAWNESCDPTVPNSPCASFGLFVLASTGGGASGLYPKPSWQTGVAGIPNDTARDVPDVSLSAADHDGYIICFDFSCSGAQASVFIIGGTSASSPSFAGIMGIVNQAAGRQGLANYKLYELAQHPSAFCNSASRTNPSVPPPSTCLFNDVVFGFNTVPGQVGFNAGTGFDLATGLGSVNASNLVNAWKAIGLVSTTLAISSNGVATITATHGQAVPLLATVTGQSTTGGIPSGSVALSSSTGPQVGAVALLPSTTNVASFNGTISNLPGGTYNLIAHYAGDGQFASSDSNTISVSISPEASNTALQTFGVDSLGFAVPATSFPYGSFMDIQANIAGASGQGTPTGTVTFLDAGAPQSLGTAGVNLKGESELFIPGGNTLPAPLTVGTHSLSANYSGDSSFNAGSSAPLTVTITKGNPKVTVSPGNLIATMPGSLIAFVDSTGPIFPSGTVQFLDAGIPLGSPETVNGNQATLPITFNTEAQHPITASYSGDATYNVAVSPAQVISVLPPFSITGTNLSATIAAGQSTNFNLFVNNSAPSTFSGTVALTCSSADVGLTCTVNPASVSLSPSTTTTNSVPITVTVTTTTRASLHGQPFPRWPMALAGVVAVALAGFRRKSKQPLFAVVALFMIAGLTSCGGGGSSTPVPPPPPPPTHATAVVQGTNGTHVSTTTLSLTITH